MEKLRPQIINCAGLFFFMTPIHGAMSELAPDHMVDCTTGPWIGGGNSYFVVGLCDFTSEAEAKVQAALEYIWSKLVERGLATGSMPAPITGNPSAMLS